MKISPMALEFVGILASVVKTSRGYMTYIGGCACKSRIVKLTALTRLVSDRSQRRRKVYKIGGALKARIIKFMNLKRAFVHSIPFVRRGREG